MGNLEGLTDRAREIGGELIQKVSEGRNPIILGRLATDGMCAASLLAKAVQRKKGKPIVRIVPSIDHRRFVEERSRLDALLRARCRDGSQIKRGSK